MSRTEDNAAARLSGLLAAGDATTLTTDKTAAENFVLPLLSAGVAMLPLRPGEKAPATPGGVYAACVDVARWSAWLDAAYATDRGLGDPALGLGIRMGSRVAVFDADTPAEVDALHGFLESMGYPPHTAPTVTTPGTADGHHHSGGHWYIALPESYAVPAGVGNKIKVGAGPDRAVLMLGGSYVAAPPTHRNGGRYEVTGDVLQMTDTLREFIADQAVQAEERRSADRQQDAASGRSPDEQAKLEEWRETTGWDQILTAAGWTETGIDGRCGCSEWLRPGSGSTKSATAHECATGTRLHIWTTNVVGLEQDTSYSMEWAAAQLLHSGELQEVYKQAGLPPKGVASVLDLQARMQEVREAEAENNEERFPEGHPNDPGLLARIFDFSEATRAIFWLARSDETYVAPVTRLIGELIRAGEVSGPEAGTGIKNDVLSFYAAAVGRSSAGKGDAFGTSPAFVRRGFKGSMQATNRPTYMSLGSGQALSHSLSELVESEDDSGRITKVREMIPWPVIHDDEDELARLFASASAGSSTLEYVLNSAWAGKPIGDTTQARGNLRVEGRYAVFMTGGLQPALAEPLVGAGAVASGFAQRVFTAELHDPWLGPLLSGDLDPGVRYPEGIEVGGKLTLPPIPEGVRVRLPDAVHRINAENKVAVACQTLDPADGHLFRMRVRLCCLYALMVGEEAVSDEVWEWSAALMEHRRRCWAATRVAAGVAAQEAVTERLTQQEVGRAEARAAVEDSVAAAGSRILDHVAAAGRGGIRQSDLAQKFGRSRAAYREALKALTAAGTLRQEKRGRAVWVSQAEAEAA